MRQLLMVQVAAALLVLPAYAQEAAPTPFHVSKVAPPGERILLMRLLSLDADCSPVHRYDMRVAGDAKHGEVSSISTRVPWQALTEAQKTACQGKSVYAEEIIYRAEANYAGADSVTVDLVAVSGGFQRYVYDIEAGGVGEPSSPARIN